MRTVPRLSVENARLVIEVGSSMVWFGKGGLVWKGACFVILRKFHCDFSSQNCAQTTRLTFSTDCSPIGADGTWHSFEDHA